MTDRLFPWIALFIIALAIAFLLNGWEEEDCRRRHGQWVHGFSGGRYVSLCIERNE